MRSEIEVKARLAAHERERESCDLKGCAHCWALEERNKALTWVLGEGDEGEGGEDREALDALDAKEERPCSEDDST